MDVFRNIFSSKFQHFLPVSETRTMLKHSDPLRWIMTVDFQYGLGWNFKFNPIFLSVSSIPLRKFAHAHYRDYFYP